MYNDAEQTAVCCLFFCVCTGEYGLKRSKNGAIAVFRIFPVKVINVDGLFDSGNGVFR